MRLIGENISIFQAYSKKETRLVLESHRGSPRRLVGMVVCAVGGSVHGRSGRCHRHRSQLDDRLEIRHVSCGILAES